MSTTNSESQSTMTKNLDKVISSLNAKIEEGKHAIVAAAGSGDLDHVERLASACKSATVLSEQLKAILKPLSKSSAELEAAINPSIHTKAAQTRLRVILQLEANGRAKTHTIEEPTAAGTLQKFIERVSNESGDKLRAIEQVACGKSGVVSRFPERDFINPNKGTVYSYLPIGDSGWSVKTSSATIQKADQIKEITKLLKLAPSSVIVEVVGK